MTGEREERTVGKMSRPWYKAWVAHPSPNKMLCRKVNRRHSYFTMI